MNLNIKESEKIRKILDSFNMNLTGCGIEEYVYNTMRISNELPERIKRSIHDMKLKGKPYLIIRGLPMVKDIPKTPHLKSKRTKANIYYQNLISIISSKVGYIYRFKNKIDQEYIEDIFPVESNKEKQIGTNSIFLNWHVEDAFHNARPDYVCLLCLRGDPEAKTLIFKGKEFIKTKNFHKNLTSNNFFLFGDSTFKDGENITRTSFIFEDSKDPEFIYDPSFMKAKDQYHNESLDKLKDYINKYHTEITLKCGDVLIFDNRRVAHSRTSYTPKFDGSNRWLLRTLIVESTWKIKESLSELTLTVE